MKENMVSPDKVDIGFAAKQVVDDAEKNKRKQRKKQVSFKHLISSEMHHISPKTTEKWLERCLPKFATLRLLNALDPKFNPNHREKMEPIMQKLMYTKWLSPSECDDSLQEFKLWDREMELRHLAVLHIFQCETNILYPLLHS